MKRIVWNSERRDPFLQPMRSAQVHEQINNVINLIDTIVDRSFKTFNKCILEAAYCMETTTTTTKKLFWNGKSYK